MYCLNPDINDPYLNLAIEELLLKNHSEEYLMFYINSPAVIIGKHQSGHREVNTRFVIENSIPVIRRITGGGSVFHDHGNLNFSFISQSESGKQVDFRKYTQPVIDFLGYMGLDARFEGKNDLKIDGLKISGNAEHVYRNRVLHHGTLLFNSSLDILVRSLRKDKSHYNSRAVESNPSSVVNLSEKLQCFDSISEFRNEMMNYFYRKTENLYPGELTEELILQAESVALSKYRSWEWNWAYGPEYHFSNSFEFARLQHKCTLFVRDGVIAECEIKGSPMMAKMSWRLIGCRHMVHDMSQVFLNENINFKQEDIYNFF